MLFTATKRCIVYYLVLHLAEAGRLQLNYGRDRGRCILPTYFLLELSVNGAIFSDGAQPLL